jgi:four helix bundle protein
MKSYTDLDVWIEARKLVSVVYLVSKNYPKEEIYGITNQIRRSAVSIPSNIAEGCGRKSSKETIYFLHIARGSLYELETQMYLSSDQKYISEEELVSILEQIVSCKKLLNGFINYYKKA